MKKNVFLLNGKVIQTTVKVVILSLLLTALPFQVVAQDDNNDPVRDLENASETAENLDEMTGAEEPMVSDETEEVKETSSQVQGFDFGLKTEEDTYLRLRQKKKLWRKGRLGNRADAITLRYKNLNAYNQDKMNYFFSRHTRTPVKLIGSPANLAMDHENRVNLALFPIPLLPMDIKINNTFANLELMNFLNGRTLTESDISDLVEDMKDNEIHLNADIAFPSLLALRVKHVNVNIGFYSSTTMETPEQLIAMLFEGISFNKPIEDNLVISTANYAKVSTGYGIDFKLDRFGTIRGGANINIYTGAGFKADFDKINLISKNNEIKIEGHGEVTSPFPLLDENGDVNPVTSNMDPMNFINPAFGMDISFGFRFKNTFKLPILNHFNNRTDFQVRFRDLFAGIINKNMYVYEATIDESAEGVVNLAMDLGEKEVGDILKLEEKEKEAEIRHRLTPKMDFLLTYQPFPSILIDTSLSFAFRKGALDYQRPSYFLTTHFRPWRSYVLSMGFGVQDGTGNYLVGMGWDFKHWEMKMEVKAFGAPNINTWKGAQISFKNYLYLF